MSHFFDQVKSALEQRQRQNRSLNVFLRDDDIDDDEASLRALLQICLRHNTPINLAVIPGRLTSAAASLLNDLLQQKPKLIELNQHGWLHLNHEREGKKCEFGASRNFAEQLADIAAGLARMNEAFGQNWFPMFVPPWNRCTATTATALDELGFRVLSREHSQPAFEGHQFAELPVTLDLYRWRGGAELRSPEEIATELSRQISENDRIGIMLHHKVMDDAAFDLLNELLQLFTRFPLVQRHTFQSLLKLTH